MIEKYAELDDNQIVNEVGMANLPKLIQIFMEKYDNQCQLINIGNDCMFRFGETNLANVSYLPTLLHFFEINSGVISIEGSISIPAILEDKFEFSVCLDGKEYRCELFDRNLDVTEDEIRYESRKVFKFSFDTKKSKYHYHKLSFIYYCDGIRSVSGKINSLRFFPVADVLTMQYAYRDGYKLSITGNVLNIEKAEAETAITSAEECFLKSAKESLSTEKYDYVSNIRRQYFERKGRLNKPVWLFFDRYDKADDNGEAFFEYVCKHVGDRADCYFVISRDSKDYDRISRIGNVIDAMSIEHGVMLPLCEYIFTSQLNGWVENPYGTCEEYFRDIYHQAKVVFLQHGVTKDNQTRWLNRYNQNLHAIVTSAKCEEQSFMTYPYFYQNKQIWNVGMPRFDKLYDSNKKTVLFMPTWRMSVMEQRWIESIQQYKWFLKDGFKESEYFEKYHSILSDKLFVKFLNILGYKVCFMPHPLMQPFVNEFEVCKDVEILPYNTRWRDLFADSSVMITDYSSVSFDYAYLKKPIIYYQFDRDSFRKGHSYSEGYFDYDRMGFGPVVKNKAQLIVKVLCALCGMGKGKYVKRVNGFYEKIDTKNCERVFRKVV